MALQINLNLRADAPIPVKVEGEINRSIRGARVDEATGQIILIFNDGSIYTVPGRVVGRGIKSITLRSDRRLIFTMDDGTTIDAGPLPRDITDTAKSLMLGILSNGLYTADQLPNINALRREFDIEEVIIPQYTLSGSLTNCESNIPMGTKFTAGSGLSLTVTPKDGYTLDGAEVVVRMNGVDITNTTYSDGVVDIAEVTGDIVLTVVAVAMGTKTYYVYQALTGMTSTMPDQVEINEGDSYEATFTPNYGFQLDGAKLTVTMGGEDITATAYSGGRVYIESVTGEVHIEGEAAEMAKHIITNNLTGVTSDNTAVSIYSGKSYSAKLTALTGYKLDGAQVSVRMGDVDITASAYENGSIYISAVTGDIVVTVVAVEVVYHSVTYKLTNCSSTNKAGSVIAGESYSTSVATAIGYSLKSVYVTMAGEDITESVLSDVTINVPSVSGDIVIIAEATAVADDYFGVAISTINCSCSIVNGTQIPAGSSCSGSFTPDSNYSMAGAEIKIFMGTVNITAGVYDENTASFTIPEVTDNISIVATAIGVLS